MLDEERANHPVVWITGPPGAGKTTLAASYVKARDLPVIWYQVDGSDTDIATFFYYLAQAGHKAADHEHLVLPLLTPDEIRAIAATVDQVFDEEAVCLLQKQTDGWAAGLVLMMERLKQTGTASPASRSETMELVFDYFASEMFDQMPLAMRQFLIRTAILPYMTLEMAIETSSNLRAKEMLDYLYHHRLFIDRRASEEAIYQYHALFREFLLGRVGDYFSTRESRNILQLGATLMERNGDIAAAAELFAKAQAWEDLMRLINSHAATLLTQGRHRTLLELIAILPETVMENMPWLLYWRGVSNTLFNTHMARTDIEQAYIGFQVTNDSAGLFLSCGAMMEIYLYAEDDMTPVVIWGDRLHQLLTYHGDFPSQEVEIRTFANLLGLVFAAPHHPLLEILEARFENVFRSTTEPPLRIAVASAIVYLPLWRGEAGKVHRIINEIALLLDHPSIPPLLRILWRNIEGGYAWSITASPDAAEQKFLDALQIAEESGI